MIFTESQLNDLCELSQSLRANRATHSDEWILDLLEILIRPDAPSPAPQEAFTQGDLMKSNPTFGPGRDHYGLDMASTEPVSESYKFKVGDRVRTVTGKVKERFENRTGTIISDNALGGIAGYRVKLDGGWGERTDAPVFFEEDGIELAAQPNPPENPDSWPRVGSRLMIGGMSYVAEGEGKPDARVWRRDEPGIWSLWLTDDQARALRHQITAEQLDELEGDIVIQVSHSLNTTAHINAAFARLRAKAQPAPSGSGNGEG